MEIKEWTLERQMGRVWDIERVKQLMHKRVFLQTWDRRQEELDTLWVSDPARQRSASYGSNWGYYVGMEAIHRYYVQAHRQHLEEQRIVNGAVQHQKLCLSKLKIFQTIVSKLKMKPITLQYQQTSFHSRLINFRYKEAVSL